MIHNHALNMGTASAGVGSVCGVEGWVLVCEGCAGEGGEGAWVAW